MQKHCIVGYGYCGVYLARLLLHRKQSVCAVSRSVPAIQPPLFRHLALDIGRQALPDDMKNSVLYYFVPPENEGTTDTLLERFLTLNQNACFDRVVYCSSSGVYGNHQGQWVTEESACQPIHARQYRRLNAEQQWQKFCALRTIPLVILRPGGIYGAQRLPIQQCQQSNPVIRPEEAPLINHIYVEDLALCANLFSYPKTATGIFNVADGHPLPMGQLQQTIAQRLQLVPAQESDYDRLWATASPMKREFMQASKRLRIDKILQALPTFRPTSLANALDRALSQDDQI